MIQKIINQNVLCDVTLVCGDGTRIQAHKLALAASSPVLENILLNNPHPHPLLYMRGIQSQEMQNILNFIYFGEVTLVQEQADVLLEVANELQIKELRLEHEKDEDLIGISKEHYSDENLKGSFDASSVSGYHEQGEIEVKDVAQESKHENIKHVCSLCDFHASSKGNLKIHQEFKHGSEIYTGVLYSCGQCDYKIKDRGTLSRHQRAKHEGIRYSCDLCDYQVMYKFALKLHKQSKHEGIRYSCILCKYEANSKGDLTRHRQSKHEGVRYSCDHCEYKTTDRSHLRRHEQRKHTVA